MAPCIFYYRRLSPRELRNMRCNYLSYTIIPIKNLYFCIWLLFCLGDIVNLTHTHFGNTSTSLLQREGLKMHTINFSDWTGQQYRTASAEIFFCPLIILCKCLFFYFTVQSSEQCRNCGIHFKRMLWELFIPLKIRHLWSFSELAASFCSSIENEVHQFAFSIYRESRDEMGSIESVSFFFAD